MRIQVNLSDEMVEKVDAYASVMGMSRSSLCAYFIGQSVMGLDKANSTIASFGESVVEMMKNHQQK